MEISRLDNEFIEKKMKQSAKSSDMTSWSNFQLGWKAAIRFAKKVEKADCMCEQCEKLLSYEEAKVDSEFTPFCNKCYNKVFKHTKTVNEEVEL